MQVWQARTGLVMLDEVVVSSHGPWGLNDGSASQTPESVGATWEHFRYTGPPCLESLD